MRRPSALLGKMTTHALVCALAAACTTTTAARGTQEGSTRVVVVDGHEVPAETIAHELLAQAQGAASADRGRARALYQRVVDEFGDTTARGPATVGLAKALLDDKTPASASKAQALLEKLLLDDPTAPGVDEARAMLAMAQLAQGDARSAAPALQAMLDKLPPDQRDEALLQLGHQLLVRHQGRDGVVALARALELMQPDDVRRKKTEAELVDGVDTGGMGFADVRAVLETEAKPGTLLHELLTWKLARVHLHLRDYASSSQTARALLDKYPRSRFAPDAKALLERLQARVQTDARVVGVILPLSGDYIAYGKRALAAIKLAWNVPIVDDKPPEPVADPTTGELVVPKKTEDKLTGTITTPAGIKLVVKDSAGKADVAAAAVRDLVEKEHAIAILGDILVDTSLPAALAAEDYAVPILSLSRREGVPEAGPWSYRLALTPRKQAEALASLCVDGMGMKRFGIMYPKHAFGVELMNEFWSALEKRKAEVTAVESYAHDQTTFTNEAKSLVGRGVSGAGGAQVAQCRDEASQITNDYRRKKALEGCADRARPIVDFEALLIPDSYRTVSYLVPALIAEDVLLTHARYAIESYKKTTGIESAKPVLLLGGNTWNDPELTKRVGKQIDGAVFVDGFDSTDGSPIVQKFVEGFGRMTRSRPQLVEAQAFDGARLLGSILDGAGATGNGERPTTREGVRRALQDTRDFPGVTGLIRFDDQGDSQTPPLFFQTDDDKIDRVERDALARSGG